MNAVLLFALVVIAAFQSTPASTLNVKLFGADGKPAAGVEVVFNTDDLSYRESCYTDADGMCSFSISGASSPLVRGMLCVEKSGCRDLIWQAGQALRVNVRVDDVNLDSESKPYEYDDSRPSAGPGWLSVLMATVIFAGGIAVYLYPVLRRRP